MSSPNTSWFLRERSEALAGLILTTRDDLVVQEEQKMDDGVDFLVKIKGSSGVSVRALVIQVRGTTSSDRNEFLKSVKNLFMADMAKVFLPVCLFVINVRTNQLFYSWIAEPVVERAEAKLRLGGSTQFRDLTRDSVGEIVHQVNQWYDTI